MYVKYHFLTIFNHVYRKSNIQEYYLKKTNILLIKIYIFIHISFNKILLPFLHTFPQIIGTDLENLLLFIKINYTVQLIIIHLFILKIILLLLRRQTFNLLIYIYKKF